VIDASVVLEAGRVRLRKECPSHGLFVSDHIWEDEEIYRHQRRLLAAARGPAAGHVINLTERCNLRCPYCFARAGERASRDLTLEEATSVIEGTASRIVYLSGGEPTLHPDLAAVISRIKARGKIAALFSNGLELAAERRAAELKSAGVDLVILQLDSLDPHRCAAIRGVDLTAQKRRALDQLSRHGIPTYLFVTVVKGENEEELSALLDLAYRYRSIVKIVNFNPVWRVGRVKDHAQLTASQILRLVERQTGFTRREFFLSTELAVLLSALRHRPGRRSTHPGCELRCYLLERRGAFVPLARVIDLEQLNRGLRALSGGGRPRPADLTRTLGAVAAAGLDVGLKQRGLGRQLARALYDLLRGHLAGISPLRALPIYSLIVGTFHDADNIDLAFQRSCNLTSHPAGANVALPACTRQILHERRHHPGASPSRPSAAVVEEILAALSG
jgi:uncharacterized radical SAM superfamily Fe-S cluster-containing enzyme